MTARDSCSCRQFSRSRGPSRREFLYVGLAGGLGLTLPAYLRKVACADQKLPDHKEPVADSIIHIFLPGGMSAQESFDPKPLAPLEYRGPLGVVKTVLPGIVFSDGLPATAKIADRLTIVRSMHHGEAAHERGTHNMFTGYRPSPAVTYPSIGSVVSHELGAKTELPPYVVLPIQSTEFAGSGFLSTRYGPFSLYSDPADKNFAVRDLSLPDGVDHARFKRRQQLLEAVESHFRATSDSDVLTAMDEFYQRAYSILSSESARAAFDLRREPGKLLDDYGRHAAGMRMVLCRRLVEAGVRFVSTTFGGWDHHANIAAGIRGQLREFDQGFSALIRDLDARGMLERTLVMVTTEFGRTPKINRDGGRDHWPRVFSVLLAGGGFHRGLVYGASDATATTVDSDPLSVEDFATTIYNQIGIVADRELMAPGNRPIEIVKGGKVMDDLLAKRA
ncbi:MAG: DUF1501 domain-containing protein [Phycisphaerales bacterium]|nr:DUF1501 domain-containing protein [Phycisphaerales bacterium]